MAAIFREKRRKILTIHGFWRKNMKFSSSNVVLEAVQLRAKFVSFSCQIYLFFRRSRGGGPPAPPFWFIATPGHINTLFSAVPIIHIQRFSCFLHRLHLSIDTNGSTLNADTASHDNYPHERMTLEDSYIWMYVTVFINRHKRYSIDNISTYID